MPVNTQPLTDAEIARWFDSPGEVPPNTFEIALVLGGTVAAGAYTAGALDFLIEALDAWTGVRDGPDAQTVPRHKVVIRLITGTSGGGVTAAIAARALAYDFPHVSRGTSTTTAAGNPFYDTWVNRLTLDDMLKTGDLDAPNATAVSLLNGAVIDDAASRATGFTADNLRARTWLANPLRLILTLTNLNGIAYRIDFGSVTLPDGSTRDLGESYINHADHARFAVAYPGHAIGDPRPDEFALGFDDTRLPQAIDWPTFAQFAMATAAFPIGFPPRRLDRPFEHYRYRVVSVPGDGTPGSERTLPLIVDWRAIEDWADGGLPDNYQFLSVDGGATDNEPIELARAALAGISGRNPRNGMEANRGVVLIDPFAGAAQMAKPLTLALPDLAEALVGAMIQQTRYDTRDILLAAYPDIYSRFMITALRDKNVGDPALATAGMGAFLGFACEAFRRHDYLLGRKNCQDFLRTQFVLPEASPIFQGCTAGVPLGQFRYTDATGDYLPIIPLVGAPRVTEATDPWPKNALNPEDFRSAIEDRFTRLLEDEFASGPLSNVLVWLAAKIGQGKVADAVIDAMQSALKQWGLA
jgi:hypothetical protein